MKKLLLISCLFFSLSVNSQCISNQSYTINPTGPYSPGQVVTVNYTLGNFFQLNYNWIIAFQINLGTGWINLTPITAPVGGGNQTGYWLWDLQNTYPSGLNFGPGWRFINTTSWGNPNWGSQETGSFTMSFQVKVRPTCTPDNLFISMNVFGDCLTGGWSNGVCCNDPVYSIYNGNVQTIPILTSNIFHN